MTWRKKILIVTAVLLVAVTAGIYGFARFDSYKENNPKFCVTCHIMAPAYHAYLKSKHAGLSCHDCHYLSLAGQQQLMFDVVFKGTDKVEPLGSKVIVPWKFCMECHFQTNKKHPDAVKINSSAFHQKHFFGQELQCQFCHGFIVHGEVHRFLPGPRFCLKCHPDRKVTAAGMEDLACLNCHTDRTTNLIPDKKKCLYCHGPAEVRKKLLEDPTMDVKFFQPDGTLINGAEQIKYDPKGSMQWGWFGCNICHDPHKEVMPSQTKCLVCHADIMSVGKHKLHIKMLNRIGNALHVKMHNLECIDCHTPHIWKITPADAKKKCIRCHEYEAPSKFIS